MSAIYSGIYLKLKSPQTAWQDRLKLARFAWISSQCLLPNKEQVLLDWCTHALTSWHSKKLELSQDVLEGLWCYLDDVLHSQKLRSFLKQRKTITLRLNMAQLLLDQLQDATHGRSQVCVSTITSVLLAILSSPVLSSVFTTKYELMVNLLAKFCSLACLEIQKSQPTARQETEPDTCQNETMMEAEPENLPDESVFDENSSETKKTHPSSNVFEAFLQVLSCYLSVQQQQANSNRVFTLVTNQLIQPLVLLRYLLTSQEFSASHSHLHLRQQQRRDIRVKIDSALHLALFPSELLALYMAELSPSKKESGKPGPRGSREALKPASVLIRQLNAQNYCEPPLLYSLKSDTSPLLFRFFVESYGKGKGESEEEQRMLCFYFLVRLFPALDLHPELQDSARSVQKSPPGSPCSPQSWSLALQAVESLFNQLLAADIYNVPADRIRHEDVQLKFYRATAQMLLNKARPSIPAWYRCLKVLLSLNHLILEPDLDQLLSSAWVNVQDLEAQVQRARQIMVCSLIQTYTKLRQLSRLFSVLLSVICQPARVDCPPPLLSDSISTSLRSCLLQILPSQVLEICSLVLKSIRTCILPDLEEREAETMEIDGAHRDQERDDASLKLFCLSQLLHVVLFSLKTLDNSSPVPLVRQSKDFMEEMQQVIKELLNLLLRDRTSLKPSLSSNEKTPKKGKKNSKKSERVSQLKTVWEQKTQEAILLLRYTWVEVDTLFHTHCSKYTSVDSFLTAAEDEDEDEAPSSSPLPAHIESLVSGSVFPSHLQSSPSFSPTSRLLLKHLTLQQMKKVLLDDNLAAESSTTELLKRAAQFIVTKSELEARLDGDQVWDGQIGSVDASTYPVAHWYLIVSNLPVMIPHLGGEDVGQIAHTLVSSLSNKQSERSKHHPPGSLTVSVVSSQLTLSSLFSELASVFSATVQTLSQRIISVLKAGHAPKGCPKFLTVLQKETVESNLSPLVFSAAMKEALVEDISTTSQKEKVHVLLTDTQIKELVNVLEILTNLNPDGINSEDLSSAFLLVLFTLTSTSRQMDQGVVEPPGTEAEPVFLGTLFRALTFLLEGVRFAGVLKLIHGSALLQTIVSSLLWHSNRRKLQETFAGWLDVVKEAQVFIRSLVQLIISRNSCVKLNLEQFASFLTNKEMASVVSSSDVSTLSVYLLLASLTSFSQTMTANFARNKAMDQILIQTLARTTSLFGPAVRTVLKLQTACDGVVQPASLHSQTFVVEVVTVMLNCEMAVMSEKTESTQLIHMDLYQVICRQILREISSAPRPTDFLLFSLHFLSAFYKTLEVSRAEEERGQEMEELYFQILQTVHRLLNALWLSPSDVEKLEPALQELLRHLVEKNTADQFNVLLLMIIEGLDVSKLRAGNWKEVMSAVILLKLLSTCHLPETCSRALWFVAPQILSVMVFLVRESSRDDSLTSSFTVPSVTSMTSLLRQGKGLIRNPHHVLLILGALQSLPLTHLSPPVYHSVFLAVHEALFVIIQCHPQVLPKAAPSFLNVFYRLVTSIIQEGRQRGDTDTGVESDVYLQCSRLVQRMYSHIAANTESFNSLPVFMVAQYVSELQKVTLRPQVKHQLTEGIYCILDLCWENDIKFLKAGLNAGVREVFNELYSSYTHYHKPQRQGEEKYTV